MDMWMDVDTALSEVPVNLMPLIDDTDFKTIEDAVAYNAAGMDLRWNFCTTAGAYTSTAVTPTTAGTYDWTHQGDGMYSIEIPASAGASINNDTEGFGWFSGKVTGVLPFRGPVIGFRAAALNDALIDSAWSTTRGLAGTALPNAAADAAGGLIISDAGGLDADAQRSDVAAILVDTGTTLDGRIPAALVGGRMDANMGAISSDSVAADNAEAFFDGTGYAGTGNVIPTVTAVTTVNGLAANVITAASIATDAGAELADAVWDEVLTGATHDINNSAGKRLRLIDAAFEVHSGTAAAGAAGTITLDSGASSVDDIYNGDRIVITGGTGAGEHGLVIDYVGSTKVATMSKNWVVTPDNTSEFEIIPADTDVESWNNSVVTGDGDWAELQTDVDDILVDTGTTLQAELDGIQADTEDIQTRLPAALVSGRMDSSTGAMAANTLTASALATDAVTEIQSGLATSAALATAQTDLDTITGANGVIIATGTQTFNMTGNVTGNLSGSVGSVTGAVGSVTAGVTVTTNNDKTGYGLSAAAVTAIWAYVVEGTWTAVMYMRLMASALFGKISGAGTTTVVIRDVDDTKNRISATVDASGNRSAFGTRDGT